MEQVIGKNIIGFDLGYKITHYWLVYDVTTIWFRNKYAIISFIIIRVSLSHSWLVEKIFFAFYDSDNNPHWCGSRSPREISRRDRRDPPRSDPMKSSRSPSRSRSPTVWLVFGFGLRVELVSNQCKYFDIWPLVGVKEQNLNSTYQEE